MMDWLQKHWRWGILALIFAAGIFVRSYHMTDWLHFELDQSRDAKVIDQAVVGGPLDLPLLGPRAGGTFLRLAPGFYWLEYLGALIIGDTIVGSAAVVTFFSILSLPLFYLLARRFFPVFMSLALLFLFSVSAFVVMYGRFAWNPNLVLFFSLLGFYALLRVSDREEIHKGCWLLASTFSLGLATHMHFLAFLAFPAIAVLFLAIKRPVVSLRFWGGAVAIIICLYLPLIINETATGGANVKEFIGALTEKSSKEDHSLIEKAVRNVSEFGLHSVVILSGFEGATFPAIILREGVIGSVCDAKCDQGKVYGSVAILLLGLALLVLFRLWQRESEPKKRDLLLLSILWFGITFVLFLPLSYGIAPRFFLINTPLFFLLLGFLIIYWQERQPVLGKRGSIAVLALLIISNIVFLSGRFHELAQAATRNVVSAPDRILKERIRVTLEQQETIVGFLEQRSYETGWPVYMASESQYQRSLQYLMNQREIKNDVLSAHSVYREGIYILIIRTQSDHAEALKKYLVNYTVGGETPFGTLVAIELVPKPEAIQADRQDFSLVPKPARSQVAPRYTLREFLGRKFDTKNSRSDDEDAPVSE